MGVDTKHPCLPSLTLNLPSSSWTHPFVFGFSHFPSFPPFSSQTTHSQLSHRWTLPILNLQCRLLFQDQVLTEPHAWIREVSTTKCRSDIFPLYPLAQWMEFTIIQVRHFSAIRKSSFPSQHTLPVSPFPRTSLNSVPSYPSSSCHLHSGHCYFSPIFLTMARVIFPKHKHVTSF